MKSSKCARCRRLYAEHVKMYNAVLRRFEPLHPDACDQYVMAATVVGRLTQITAAIDWLTAKVLSSTLGRKH
jgi:hypothetical protein